MLIRTRHAAFLAATSGLFAMNAAALEVELRMVEGDQTLRGELIDQTATHVRVKSRFGEIELAKRDVICSSNNCPWEDVSEVLEAPVDPGATTTAALGTQEVQTLAVFPSPTTSQPAAAQPAAATPQPEANTTALAAVSATVVGAAVAATTPGRSPERTVAQRTLPDPDLLIRGSDTVGADLMPLLIEGYANMNRSAVIAREDQGDDMVALDIHTDFGAGERMLVAAVESKGSSTGLKALLAQETDIAMTSRPAKAKEVEALASQGRGDLRSLNQEYIVAVDSVLVVVSPDNPIRELRVEALADAMSGRVTNWSELGGPDLPINVYTRDSNSGTRGLIENSILKPQQAQFRPDARIVESNAEMADLVTRDPGGIGFVGFASVRGAKPIDLVSACGIRMDSGVFGAKTEEYPLERRLRLYVDNTELAANTQGLLDYAISTDAEPLVQKAGFIDLGIVEAAEGLAGERIRTASLDARDPFATQILSRMATDLAGARRLSTTFRFSTGSSVLDNKAQRDLARMVEYLSRPQNVGREVLVIGFTDSDGPFSANAALSQRRADAVVRALWSTPGSEQMADLSMRATGYGELSPVDCNESYQGRQRNRRVEIWIR